LTLCEHIFAVLNNELRVVVEHETKVLKLKFLVGDETGVIDEVLHYFRRRGRQQRKLMLQQTDMLSTNSRNVSIVEAEFTYVRF